MSRPSGTCDVAVLGAGPAGYVAAIRAAQLGLKTVCVDDWTTDENKASPGGTCLNAGCIPSKALLESSEHYADLHEGLRDHGISVDNARIDINTMMERKQRIVKDLTQGVQGLLKSNKVQFIHGTGSFNSARIVSIHDKNGRHVEDIQAENIILAAGSVPAELAVAPIDHQTIVDSTDALSFSAAPVNLGVIGAGVIGLELGSVWRRLGSKVILLEAQSEFLHLADYQIAREARRFLEQQGLDIRLGARVTGCDKNNGSVAVRYEDDSGTHTEKFDKLIVAAGRRANSQALATDENRLLLDEWGVVHVDDKCRTNLPNVWAIGDLVRGPMLAHKGSEEGIMVAESIAGIPVSLDYNLIPSVIYTHPEIAWVGKTEQILKTEGTGYHVGRFPFAASGRARALGDTRGFVKVLADAEHDRVLGVHIIGPQASELVAQAVVAMGMGASSEDLAMTVFAHPTLSEALHEAALSVEGRAIHVATRRR